MEICALGFLFLTFIMLTHGFCLHPHLHSLCKSLLWYKLTLIPAALCQRPVCVSSHCSYSQLGYLVYIWPPLLFCHWIIFFNCYYFFNVLGIVSYFLCFPLVWVPLHNRNLDRPNPIFSHVYFSLAVIFPNVHFFIFVYLQFKMIIDYPSAS